MPDPDRWDADHFHASAIRQYLTCPRQYYFRHVLKLASNEVAFAAITGSAYHHVISWWHRARDTDGMAVPDTGQLLDEYRNDVERRVARVLESGQELLGYDDAAQDRVFAEAPGILGGYAADPRNAVALVANERRFRVKLSAGGKTVYPFAGTLDQVRRRADGTLDLVDLKSGKTKPHDVLLALDYQLSVYALALAKGELEDVGDLATTWVSLAQPPSTIAICHLRDYLPKQKNEFSEETITDEMEINPKTGRQRKRRIPNPKFADGYKKGDIGPVFYRTQRSPYELLQAEKDLARVCAAIRFKMWFRRPVQQGACIGFCRYVSECSAERSDPL